MGPKLERYQEQLLRHAARDSRRTMSGWWLVALAVGGAIGWAWKFGWLQ
jgi:hypothetical protein